MNHSWVRSFKRGNRHWVILYATQTSLENLMGKPWNQILGLFPEQRRSLWNCRLKQNSLSWWSSLPSPNTKTQIPTTLCEKDKVPASCVPTWPPYSQPTQIKKDKKRKIPRILTQFLFFFSLSFSFTSLPLLLHFFPSLQTLHTLPHFWIFTQIFLPPVQSILFFSCISLV